VYELPVDDGRRDAAPPNGGGNGSGGAGGGAPSSSFRSENNFGTSSIVPGDPRAEGGKQGQNEGVAGGNAGNAQAVDSGVADPAAALDTGDTSSAQNYLLLALIAGGGLLLGVIAARTRATADPST
jgi:hypothetical protein